MKATRSAHLAKAAFKCSSEKYSELRIAAATNCGRREAEIAPKAGHAALVWVHLSEADAFAILVGADVPEQRLRVQLATFGQGGLRGAECVALE